MIGQHNEKASAVKRPYVLRAADENGEGLCDRRIGFVHTPKHGWLNIAETERSVLNRIALKERIGSKAQLEKQSNAYLNEKTMRLNRSTGNSLQKTPEPNLKSYTRIPALERTLV